MIIFDDSVEERELLGAFEKGDLKPLENEEEMKKVLQDAAKATIAKTKHIGREISDKAFRGYVI